MAFVSSHIDLQNCLRFLTGAFVIFLLQDKVKKEKKIELPAEKSHNFLMRGIKIIRRYGIVGKLSDNSLSKFQPIWFRGCLLGIQNARSTRLFFTFEKQGKCNFGCVQE